MLGPVIPNTYKMGVVPACMVLVKEGPRNITGQPDVSIIQPFGPDDLTLYNAC